jgi:hypothetical protein
MVNRCLSVERYAMDALLVACVGDDDTAEQGDDKPRRLKKAPLYTRSRCINGRGRTCTESQNGQQRFQPCLWLAEVAALLVGKGRGLVKYT